MTTSEAALCARNNALWCDAVCRAHGLPGEFLAGLWLNRRPVPRFYANAVTLSPKDPAGQRAWVEHLLWCAARTDGEPAETVIVGTESIWKLAPVSAPLPVLEELLGRYWSGLSQPLKFFPESSYAFAAADYKALTGTKGKTVKSPIDFARDKWNGNDFGAPGEGEDEYFALFFKNGDSLDGDFEAHARAVFHPLLEVSQEVKE